jgi:hypothetical protein
MAIAFSPPQKIVCLWNAEKTEERWVIFGVLRCKFLLPYSFHSKCLKKPLKGFIELEITLEKGSNWIFNKNYSETMHNAQTLLVPMVQPNKILISWEFLLHKKVLSYKIPLFCQMGTPLSDAFERAVETQVFQGNLRWDFQSFMQIYLTWAPSLWLPPFIQSHSPLCITTQITDCYWSEDSFITLIRTW